MKCLFTRAFFLALITCSSVMPAFSQQQPALLPNRTLLHFSLSKKHDGVEIKGTLSGSHTYDSILIERASSPSSFSLIAELPAGSNAGESSFTFTDHNPGTGVNYYRIVLFNTPQNIQEISNTLMLKIIDEGNNLKVYNTILQANDPSVSIYSIGNDELSLQVADLSGRILYHSKVQVYSGTNSINMSGFLPYRGYCMLLIKNATRVVTQKMIVQ